MTPYIDNGMRDDLSRDIHLSQRGKKILAPREVVHCRGRAPTDAGSTPGPRQPGRHRPPEHSGTPPSLLRQTLAGQNPKAASAS